MNNAGSVKPKDINSSSELVFIYNISQREILFQNVPFDSFFESVDMQTEPFFLNSFDNDLLKDWQSCLQLKEKEKHNFSRNIVLADNTPAVFNFHVEGISLPSLVYSSLLLFFIRRTIVMKSTPDYGKDYAEFIDLAAHDLDAPLRKLSLLIERLAYKSKTEPVKDFSDYISRIQTNLAEMRLLIDGLAMLAKINSAIPEKVSCNPENIVTDISHKWEERIKKKGITLSVSPLPKLMGDGNQYKQLFSHILDNAIKFSRETDGCIEINSTDVTPEEKRIYPLTQPGNYGKINVTDDGIGFKDEYAEKIFQPFVRLNGKQYPGNGIGLAACKKIVENNNGIIYAKGEENKGASFTIILPQSLD